MSEHHESIIARALIARVLAAAAKGYAPVDLPKGTIPDHLATFIGSELLYVARSCSTLPEALDESVLVLNEAIKQLEEVVVALEEESNFITGDCHE